ncbi:MAG: TolC family protein [Bdellovibrionota bacterium]
MQLKTAVDEALKYSPVVQRSKANMEDAQWRKAESYNGLLPTLTGDINYLLAKKYVQFDAGSVTINQVLPSSQFILTGNLPVFDGFSNFNRLRAGARQFDAAENDYEWTEFTISMQTTLLFYRALVARNLMDVADQNEKTIQDHYKDVTALQKAGVATKFDVLRVGVQVKKPKLKFSRHTMNMTSPRFVLPAPSAKKKILERQWVISQRLHQL